MCKTTPTTFCQKGSAQIQILQVSNNYHSLCLRISGQQRTLSVNVQCCCFAPHFGWNFATCHKPYLLLCIYPVATAGASRSQPLGDHPVPADQAGTFQTRQLSHTRIHQLCAGVLCISGSHGTLAGWGNKHRPQVNTYTQTTNSPKLPLHLCLACPSSCFPTRYPSSRLRADPRAQQLTDQ